MSAPVHLSVIFACDENDGVAKLAKKHLALLQAKACLDETDPGYEYVTSEPLWFLEELAKRSGPNQGSKGGVSAWGTIGNATCARTFVSLLEPFFFELLNHRNWDEKGEGFEPIDGGPMSHEHVIVLHEFHDKAHTDCIEIYLDNDEKPPKERKLVIEEHERLPFAFMQA